jgi:hypothetical protein
VDIPAQVQMELLQFGVTALGTEQGFNDEEVEECSLTIERWVRVDCTLQHTAAHFSTLSTLQHTSAHCSTLQHTSAHFSTLQHTAAHCSTLQHTSAHCSAVQRSAAHKCTVSPYKHSICTVHLEHEQRAVRCGVCLVNISTVNAHTNCMRSHIGSPEAVCAFLIPIRACTVSRCAYRIR